ncbi:MAG: NADH-quinone oxidoreductase subunit NuoK [Oligoflexales bacterium]|nr:NADH-quinone oxidoreductase subunit NuoK [Oligoflexales bacterium]
MDVPLSHHLILAMILFFCGVLGVLFRRNLLFVLMSIELMLNAVNLVFVSGSVYLQNLDGQIMVFFVVTVAACEAAVGLAMVIALFREHGTVQTDSFRILRG